jgi:DNA replication and repair protein RecF
LQINRLELFNFRNYPHEDVEFSPRENIVVGMNAQGKTNLLEAIYLLSHLKSPRTPRTTDLVRDGEPMASVKGLIEDGADRMVLKLVFGESGKTIEVNGRKQEKTSRVIGLFKCVLFTPDDLYLVRGEPARRRTYLDEIMEVLGKAAPEGLQKYRHLLKQRNALLKRWESYGAGLNKMLEPWDREMARAGSRIVVERDGIVEKVGEAVKETYSFIAEEKATVQIEYRGTFPLEGNDPAGEMIKALKKEREREKRYRTTMVGPHRDEVEIRIGGREARYSASQGEQRAIAFCLRFAQAKIIEEKTGRRPAMLLDDVLSELDGSRAGRVLELARRFKVKGGVVEVEGA